MPRPKKDYSRLVAIDLSPTDAAIIAGCLRQFKRQGRVKLGSPVYDLIEGMIDNIQRQLGYLDWPQEKGGAEAPPE